LRPMAEGEGVASGAAGSPSSPEARKRHRRHGAAWRPLTAQHPAPATPRGGGDPLTQRSRTHAETFGCYCGGGIATVWVVESRCRAPTGVWVWEGGWSLRPGGRGRMPRAGAPPSMIPKTLSLTDTAGRWMGNFSGDSQNEKRAHTYTAGTAAAVLVYKCDTFGGRKITFSSDVDLHPCISEPAVGSMGEGLGGGAMAAAAAAGAKPGSAAPGVEKERGRWVTGGEGRRSVGRPPQIRIRIAGKYACGRRP